MSLENIINYGKREFIIQWHITNKCDFRCQHCYIPHTEKEHDNPNKLNLTQSYKIIDELSKLTKRWNIIGRINFSGGNPLLDKNFFEFANYASHKKIRIGILGNPTSVLKEDILKKLKGIPVWRYQISIDGLKENHEKLRGEAHMILLLKH